jgi:hypothetical protein
MKKVIPIGIVSLLIWRRHSGPIKAQKAANSSLDPYTRKDEPIEDVPARELLRGRLRFKIAAGRAETRTPSADSDGRRVFVGRNTDARPRDNGKNLKF